jgi:hypothetical protein
MKNLLDFDRLRRAQRNTVPKNEIRGKRQKKRNFERVLTSDSKEMHSLLYHSNERVIYFACVS